MPEGQLQKSACFVGLCVSGRLQMSHDIAVAVVRRDDEVVNQLPTSLLPPALSCNLLKFRSNQRFCA